MTYMDEIIKLSASIGRISGRLETIVDNMALRSDVNEIKNKLDDHILMHKKAAVSNRRMRIAIISAIATAIPALIAAIFK